MEANSDRQGLEWQIGVWDRISQLYLREIDPRFAPVVENVIARGRLQPGQHVLDLGTGTATVATAAAPLVIPGGRVTAVDISPEMLTLARRRVADSGRTNVATGRGRRRRSRTSGEGTGRVSRSDSERVMSLAPQLERIHGELTDARRRAHEIAAPLGPERWSTRPAVDEWSVAECLIHLNLTSGAFLPLIRDAIARGRDRQLFSAGPYRRDVVGWVLSWLTEPPVRLRIKTTASFVPASVDPKDRVLEAFDMLQEQLTVCVREADGLALGRLRVISPFDARIKYNLYSCLRIIPAHQRQHLAQAQEVIDSFRAGIGR
jgi:SAM-dependent methyltransferase